MIKDKKTEVIQMKGFMTLCKWVTLVVEIIIVLFLIMHVLILGFDIGTHGYSLYNGKLTKQEYAKILSEDEEIFGDSFNSSVIQNNEASSGEIIFFYWIVNINIILGLILLHVAVLKLRKFFSFEKLFSNESLLVFKDVVKCFSVLLAVNVIISIIQVATPFDYYVFDFDLVCLILFEFIYCLLYLANKEILENK